jgi:tetratricopeptide (TPR) repeat protein
LFVTEVVRLLVQEGELSRESTGQRESWTVRIPEEVREVIGRRLDRLSERCNQTLTIAAVVGREFELRQLKSLVEDMTEDRLLEVLEEALATRIIEELPRTLGRYQFTHALNQETLLEELSLTRRVRLHARIAQELEKLYGQHAEAHAAELAHHFGQAEAMLGPEKVVKYSLLAGEKALASYAWEEALAHFQRGLESKGGDPVDAQTAALLFGLGRSQAATLDRIQFGAAVKSLSRAFDYYADNNEVDHAVAVAEYPLSSTIPALFAGATQMIPRALDLVPTDSLQAGYLLSRYGLDLGRVQGNYKGAQEAFARALKIATEENEALLEMRTLTTAAEVDYWFCRYQDGLTKCLQSLELVREVDDPSTERSARLNAAWSCVALGDLDGANLHSLASLDVAKKIGNRDLLGQSLATAAMIAGLMGDSKSAGEFLDLAPARSTRLLIARIVLAFESGNFDEGRVYLQQLLDRAEDYPPGPSSTASMPALLIPYIARLTGVLDGVENARTIANSILSIPTATPSAILIVRFGLGLIAVMHGDVEDAREQYLAIKQWRGTNLTNLVVTDRLLGLLAQTWGDLNVSADHFEDSQVFCRRGYRPELAWTCCDYADTLLARNQPGDRQRAMAFLDECLKITRELGMRPLMERALSRREILKA